MNATELQAIEIGNNKQLLKARLLYTRDCLAAWIRPYYKKYRIDYTKKQLIGSDGYFIQWRVRQHPDQPVSYNNQQTITGYCSICQNDFTWDRD